MFVIPLILTTFIFSSGSQADDRGKLIFSDDFERTELQELKDEVGNGWGTNSRTRAGGNKQVDLKDGAMYIFIHQAADHAVSVTHPAEFRNGLIELRFMLENPGDTLGLDFADLQCKSVHAGHLFKVTVGNNKLDISDLKNGSMALDIYNARKQKQLTTQMNARLKNTKKQFPAKLETGKWYSLGVQVQEDTVTVAIDGKQVGAFSSDGFAHPTKKMLRLSVPKQAVVDDVKIYSKSAT